MPRKINRKAVQWEKANCMGMPTDWFYMQKVGQKTKLKSDSYCKPGLTKMQHQKTKALMVFTSQ